MDLSTSVPQIIVRTGRPLRLDDARGERIAVVQGHAWITQDRDPRDLVLHAGEEFVIDRAGTTIITSLDGPAVVAKLGRVI